MLKFMASIDDERPEIIYDGASCRRNTSSHSYTFAADFVRSINFQFPRFSVNFHTHRRLIKLSCVQRDFFLSCDVSVPLVRIRTIIENQTSQRA